MKTGAFYFEVVALVRELIADIGDDYRSSGQEPDDTEPQMDLTVGADADGWSYQTGDNSFTGGAYGYARPWAVVTLTRDSDPSEIADDIVSQLGEHDDDDGEPPTFDPVRSRRADRADVRKFIAGYLECALWASSEITDDGTESEPLDTNFSVSDLAPRAMRQAIRECLAFYSANAADLAATGANDDQSGHDYWLTRNRHGAGFWDRGYERTLSKRLTDAAHADGSRDLYAGDDGKLYFF